MAMWNPNGDVISYITHWSLGGQRQLDREVCNYFPLLYSHFLPFFPISVSHSFFYPHPTIKSHVPPLFFFFFPIMSVNTRRIFFKNQIINL
ncbi:hypothetical protein MtrunA17_Chr7g0240621 [Medicago truncatula]|uniref:Transmembrane protein n=1 Tax=Medicago truncatula TaxID=3880 RepID=A0A396H553_MEDTR|nr:hypothetical protein MtrunA17_Chr7g0240621 [Medicago truncatula]